MPTAVGGLGPSSQRFTRRTPVQRMSADPPPTDWLIDPETLWSRSAAIRGRLGEVKDAVVADQMRLLADDMVSLAVEMRLASIVERTRR
jgi:hypothetical protein